MAGGVHGSARTTPRVRAELQASKETGGALARRYGLSRATVAKWCRRTTTSDAPMGPTVPRSTVLFAVEEATIVEFRRRTLLPLDPDPDSLKAHGLAFVAAHNFAKHLRALRRKTPFKALCHAWTTTPELFKLGSHYLIPGPNT